MIICDINKQALLLKKIDNKIENEQRERQKETIVKRLHIFGFNFDEFD